MHIVSTLVALWMGLLSGFGFMHAPATPPQARSAASSTLSATASTSASASVSALDHSAGPQHASATGTAHANSNAPIALTAGGSASTSATGSGLPATGSAWQTSLPLGDGKYVTSGPKKGYIYLCNVVSGGQGAQGTATWINGSTWYPAQKVAVEGSVAWPNASYSMKVNGSTRIITANGLPTDHNSGVFPIAKTDPAHQFDGNPNSITAQDYSFSLPASPTMLAAPQCIFGQVGIMNDGVPLFDGFDAEYRDAVAHETQDAWEAHPDQSGVYHYHGFEAGYLNDSAATVVGFAFDGYPITGGKLSDGTYLTTNDLDECHGITSTVTLDGKNVTTYHYVLTQDFPYSVSCFRGKSYEPKPGGGSGSGNTANGSSGGTNTPPAAAVTACASLATGDSCSFTAPKGTVSGTCAMPPNQSSLACVPNQ